MLGTVIVLLMGSLVKNDDIQQSGAILEELALVLILSNMLKRKVANNALEKLKNQAFSSFN